MKTMFALSTFLMFPFDALAGETTFVVGSRPWNFSQRSRENHITMHMRGPDAMRAPQSGIAGQGSPMGLGYVSNSYAIGNWVQVDMTLGDGSEGLIMIENDQTNKGDQQSVSDILGELIETYQADDQSNHSQ